MLDVCFVLLPFRVLPLSGRLMVLNVFGQLLLFIANSITRGGAVVLWSKRGKV